MNEFDKAIKLISNKLFTYQYQEELFKILQEQERDNWLKEQLRLRLTGIYDDKSYEFMKSVSELDFKKEPVNIDIQISNIKHQLKYEKNPLVIKNLNRKMNKLIKEKKNVKNDFKIY